MSHQIPADDWFKAPSGGERLWIGLALAWCLILTLMMPYWHFKGKQNSTGEAYRVAPADFAERVNRFVAANTVGEDKGVAVVAPPPGTDVYLQAQMWRWYPVLKLKRNQTYRVHISSLDLNHGFSLQPLNMNFQVIPGYDHVLTLTPTSSGDFSIICNEFCGIGHHLMAGKIIVED
ncbi:MAG: cytochrome C oxidase subunit II [Deltaproteobacteria bacterium]|nr:cytochrome C oxidase subunit II [Deltaproteobacteria bacterium]